MTNSLTTVKFWDKNFMTDEVTTVGSTIYIPRALVERPDTRSVLKVMAYATVGIAHRKKLKALWYLLYGYPQCLSLLALGALVGGPMWLLWFLVLVLPCAEDLL